ncbi:hypothetical protein [Rickettsiella massiliensis]|uniref:hypothetical protein n=1 Tax=Rickettsiella massiliensis TaxID=676517 RepID=UPI00029A63F0|nr:hypothetical protein [Rickettsiella massiliensis]
MKVLKEIPACFWAESKTGYLETHEKLLLIYLISHPVTNRLGCFRLPLRYMAYDLEWSEQYTTACFNKLIRFNFLIWDPITEWSYLTDFLNWFPIKNSYQGKYIEHVFEEIPETAIIFKIVVGHLLQISYLDKIFRQRLISCWKKTLEKEVDAYDPVQEK